ncbi:uncharacterized protein [Populus alba]|uniref:uncharacterized protein n=1 Tax=Populus alba TaxID=43335 RepID=UPI003CC72E5B
MEHEERAHLESRYQSELESVKSEVSRMSNLLEQLLKAKSGEGTSAQPATSSPISHIPIASPILGADSVTEQHFAPAILIRPAHTLPTVDLTTDGPVDSRSSNFISQDKISALEERLRAVEGNDWFDPTRAADDSLSGSALNWYMRLETVKIKTWKDLVEAFLKQYKFNLEIAPDRTSLMSMEKRSQESVRVYAQRWRDEATHVQPPLIETEMNSSRWGGYHFEDPPNVISNPLPKHTGSSSGVGMIEIGNQGQMLKVSMKRLYDMLLQSGFLNISTTCQLGSDNYCEFHRMEGHHIEDCVKFRQKVAKMLLMGELRLETLGGNQEVSMMEGQDKLSEVCRVQPLANGFARLILTKPSFTKRDHSAMPYNYVCTSNIQAPLPLFYSEVSGLTRSGRCFTPEELKKAKGKEMVDLDKEVEVNEPVTEKESNEFLKLIKHSEYCIVDQLKKTPARISLMSLILSSEPHRNALQKVLNEAYVPQDIEQKTMEHLVGRIHASNYLYFTADELSAEGTGHKQAIVYHREMQRFPYWKAGAVPSSLHQCLKYIMNGMLVTVKAEETISMVKNVTIPFLEAEDCTDENLHAFEIVNTEWVPESTVLRKPKISTATKMAVRCFLEHGIPFQYDPITGIPKRIKPITMRVVDQRFGLGYKPKKEDHRWAANKRRERRMARIEGREPEEEEMEIPPLMVSFPKAAYVMEPDNRAEDDIQRMATMSINTLEDDKEEGSGTKTIVEMEDEVLPQLTVEMEDEMLPQLTVHILEELPTKTFVRRLAEGEKFQNWVTQEAPLDMPGLNTNIVVHKIPLEEGCKPVKQKLRRAHPETWIKVKAELEKQWNAGFLEVVTYPQWVSNIVVVPKKEGKIRVCVDFRDLNKASPKDDFPLPHIDILVDNTARSSTYSFMDGFSGYNQIKMAIEKTGQKQRFVTPWGTYCYKVMPFGLKNAGATYQRAMSGKLLGFVVSGKGIEVDPDKTKAIQSMPTPKSEKEHDETGRKERAIYYLSKKFTELNVYGNGAGAVIVSPDQKLYPVSVKLHFECTNNTAEYEACILGLEDALEMKIKKLDVYGDSMLIILSDKVHSLGREGNHFADALATLAAMATIDLGHRKVVKRFIEKRLDCRYGVPEKIVTDNAQNFNGKMIAELCTKWKIKHSNSSPYRPKMNGAVEAANKKHQENRSKNGSHL